MRSTLEEAIEKYELNIFRAAYAICKNRQDAEDVCQDTFLAYYRSHKIDITKQIEKRGYAQEKIKDGLLADYITVVWDEDGGYSLGTDYHKFPDVEELRENTK